MKQDCTQTLSTLTRKQNKALMCMIFILVLRMHRSKAVHLCSYSNPYSLTCQGGTVWWLLLRPTSWNANFSWSFLIAKILFNISISFVKFVHRPRLPNKSISNSLNYLLTEFVHLYCLQVSRATENVPLKSMHSQFIITQTKFDIISHNTL